MTDSTGDLLRQASTACEAAMPGHIGKYLGMLLKLESCIVEPATAHTQIAAKLARALLDGAARTRRSAGQTGPQPDRALRDAILDRMGFREDAVETADGSANDDLAYERTDAVMEFIDLAATHMLPRKLLPRAHPLGVVQLEPGAPGAPGDPGEPAGRMVRKIWVEWAKLQHSPKASWLLPWEQLDAGQREVDIRIGTALFEAGQRSATATPHEWQCPSCGATTRARMADSPIPPGDHAAVPSSGLRERIARAIRSVFGELDWDDCEDDYKAADAVMAAQHDELGRINGELAGALTEALGEAKRLRRRLVERTRQRDELAGNLNRWILRADKADGNNTVLSGLLRGMARRVGDLRARENCAGNENRPECGE